jgi:hypothetical protein
MVTRPQVEKILADNELDVHRRRMYEAALKEFDKHIKPEQKETK